jgi:hypothetical protein
MLMTVHWDDALSELDSQSERARAEVPDLLQRIGAPAVAHLDSLHREPSAHSAVATEVPQRLHSVHSIAEETCILRINVRQPHDTSTIGAEAGVGREIATPIGAPPVRTFPRLHVRRWRWTGRRPGRRNCVSVFHRT